MRGQVRRQAALVIAVVDGDELGADGGGVVQRRRHDDRRTLRSAPTSSTVRTGCTTWPAEYAASACSMASMRSGIGRHCANIPFGQ